ncbi:hypothetical protein F4780DRAFT_730199 [Xylariomycetidae sp. FL0641]|nr:hypothetical protein F4780DRAFT_730199 [Xylariomycetidae sp. FL0641]
MSTNGNFINHSDQFQPFSTAPTTSTTDETSSSTSANNLGKDEVAWFFVEQYYTTLSKHPEKLHLFYSKRSQFVYGQEAQVANVSVGRQAIQERIKELDFQDCKVRVSNVDSQASYEQIIIQVIGETSNKAGDPKKFVQTFVLAQQPSGYFVLNDILRYIDEDVEDEPAEAPVPAEPVEEAATVPVEEAKAEEADQTKKETVEETPATLDAIDNKLEEVKATEQETAPANGEPAVEAATEQAPAAPEPATKAEEPAAADPEVTAKEVAEETAKEEEKPTDPSPTPVATRKPAAPAAAPAPAPAPAPAQPPKPMTWASRAAAAAGPKPVVPLPKTATPPAAARTTAPAQPAAAQPAAPAAPSAEPAAAPAPAAESTEWQTAGGDSKRQNRPQSISGPPAEKEGTMGYVKYVTEKVKNEDLRSTLAQHGELVYFDINRQKNCAFVEFKHPAGYQAAVAANPHVVNGESIVVEPRRPKAGAYGGANYANRGNMANRGGRGGFDGSRSGSQGGRGSFGRGGGRGGGMPRGRGASQAANA